MHLIVSLILASLNSHIILANPHVITKKATLPEPTPVAKRQFLGERLDSWSIEKSACSSVLSIPAVSELASGLANPPSTVTFDQITWCSEFLQSTSYVYQWTLTELTTITQRRTSTLTVTRTAKVSTDWQHTTTTSYCASPSQSVVCAKSGAGLTAHYIHFKNVLNASTCQQTCLIDPACRSFQFGLNGANGDCYTFDVPVTGNTGNGTSGDNKYTGLGYPYSSLWDRNCQDVRPAGCKKHQARESREAKEEQGVEKREMPLPDWLEQYDEYDAWHVCSCLITSASPTSTFTYTPVSLSLVTASVTVTVTKVLQSAVTPFLKTAYKIVA